MISDKKIIGAYEINNLSKNNHLDYFNNSLKIFYRNILNEEEKKIITSKSNNYNICLKLYNLYLDLITKKLSSHFKIEENKKYFEILIGYWLLRTINLSQDIVFNYENKKIKKSDKILVEKFKYQNLINYNYSHFNFLTSKFIFYNQLISLFFEETINHTNLDFIEILRKEDNEKNKEKSSLIDKIRKFISKSFYLTHKLKFFFINSDKIILSHLFFFPLKNKFFNIRETIKSYSFFFKFFFTKKVDYLVRNKFDHSFNKQKKEIDLEKRKLIFNFESNSLLEKTINKIILYSFPIECFENFNKYKNKNFRKYKKIFNTGPHLADGKIKFSIADAVSNGAELVLSQVGGSYGVVENLISQEFDFKTSDKFMSWGWVDYKNLNVFPSTSRLGNSLVTLSKKKYSKPKKKILLILANLFLPRREWGDRMQSEQFINYCDRNLIFLNGIDKNIKDNLFLRPYNFDCLMTNNYFKNKYKFTHENYYKGLLDSKLIISTYNSTTFLECFTVNVPCLLFWEDKEWLFNENNYSKKDFSILKKNNILFNDPIELSKFINKNYSNIETWWYGEKVQNIIKDFRNKYIYSEN